jgi:hypothetical protein
MASHPASRHRYSVSIALSGQHGSFHGQRQGDRTKRFLRIKIILARLIDDPKQTVFLGSGIAKRDVNFPLFE